MSNDGSTPGPWEMHCSYTGGVTIGGWRNGLYDPVASVLNEANGRLIAAVPDLLKALEEIAYSGDPAANDGSEHVRCGDIARDAIAKAKGV